MSATGPKINRRDMPARYLSLPISLAPPRRARGFTLLEILVVLVIMAAMAGLLVFGFKDSPAQRLRREANELAGLLNAAADEAVLHGFEMGLAIDSTGYRFVYFDGEKKQWLAVPEKMLAPHSFVDEISVAVVLDGAHIDEQAQQRIQLLSARSEDMRLRPTVLLLSSGEVTPFTLTLGYGEDLKVVVSGDGLNPIVVERAVRQSARSTGAGQQRG